MFMHGTIPPLHPFSRLLGVVRSVEEASCTSAYLFMKALLAGSSRARNYGRSPDKELKLLYIFGKSIA
jgi:hypothetical protein